MAKPNTLPFLLISYFLSLLLLPSTSIPEAELESAMYSLRSRGYHLFGNAITASDVRFDFLLSNASFTLFAPTDAGLFSLDMSSPAAAYVAVLRRHVAFGRFPLHTLRVLSPGTALPTLLPSREVILSHRDSVDTITVDDVEIVFPGLFYGENLAVHGLGGILTERQIQPSESPAPAFKSPDSRHSHAISRGFHSDWPSGISEPRNHRVPSGAPVAVHKQSESPTPAFRSPDSRHPYYNSPDFPSDPEPKHRRVPNEAPAMDLESSESPAPAFRSLHSHHRYSNSPDSNSDWSSGSAGVEIPKGARGVPEVSLGTVRARGSSGILISSEMNPFTEEIPGSSRTASPMAAFSCGDGTLRDSEGL